jgi:hypothetical protein
MAASVAAALLPACTTFEPGSDVLASERNATLAVPGEDWSCLTAQAPAEPPPPPRFAGDARRVVVSGRILDLSTGAAYPSTRVRACGIADIDCTAPVIEDLRVNEEGWVDIPVFDGFDGFLEITSDELLSSLFFFSEPLQEPSQTAYPWGVVSRASVPPLITLVGVPQQEDRGFLAVRAFDCNLTTAPGVSFTLLGEGAPFYFIGGLPTGAATATDGVGLGGFSNVPAGLAVLEGWTPDGTAIMSPQTVVIRPGWVSTLFLQPPESLRDAPR